MGSKVLLQSKKNLQLKKGIFCMSFFSYVHGIGYFIEATAMVSIFVIIIINAIYLSNCLFLLFISVI